MVPTTCVFDLDGTIWDSYPWYAAVLQHLGLMSVENAMARLEAGENIMRLLRNGRVPATSFLLAGAAMADSLALYDGVPEVLRELAERRVSMGILSGLSASLGGPMLTQVGLSAYFPVSLYGAQKSSAKPYRRVADLLGVPVRTAVYVGDTPKDALGATTAGMAFWWAAYGYYSGTKPVETTRVLGSFRDILSS